jgi:hypothetical protein
MSRKSFAVDNAVVGAEAGSEAIDEVTPESGQQVSSPPERRPKYGRRECVELVIRSPGPRRSAAG